MTPADKAKALLKKCRTVAPYAVSDTIAKRAAMIVCEEVINELWNAPEEWKYKQPLWDYWRSAKAELEKL